MLVLLHNFLYKLKDNRIVYLTNILCDTFFHAFHVMTGLFIVGFFFLMNLWLECVVIHTLSEIKAMYKVRVKLNELTSTCSAAKPLSLFAESSATVFSTVYQK